MWKRLIVPLMILALGLLWTRSVFAAEPLVDTDGDGIPDLWETQVYHTDPLKADTDGDGYSDKDEIMYGYNPNGKGVLAETDTDKDGLSDRMELAFGTDPLNPDTDGDGFPDGVEVANGFSPTSSSSKPLPKDIVVQLSTQRLEQRLNGIVIATYPVSTGTKRMPTPVGTYKIMNKNKRQWSHVGKLWMPYWMQVTNGGVGLHELPEWPNGKKEGADHLGKPASHGCVRLGVGPAKKLYEWAPVGTPVKIIK